ncbi:MAG TPA: c-type cytochrome [Candidatus Sulfobium mesophilum]|nr:c-type cytochrome [Candidatus Sulfobium mesophilum]
MRIHLSAFFPLILLTCLVAAFAESAEPTGSYERGKALFERKCAPCHSIGTGKKVGTDLRGVTERRKRDWLVK